MTDFSPYFPVELFGQDDRAASGFGRNVEAVLSSLKEGPLYRREEKPPFRIYRFTWLRSFHPAIVIVVSFGPQLPARLQIKSLSQNSLIPHFFEPRTADEMIEDEAVESLIHCFRSAEFLKVPPCEPRRGIFLDGAAWIVEAVEPGVYHAAYRHSPKDGPIYDLGREFLRIAKLEHETIY